MHAYRAARAFDGTDVVLGGATIFVADGRITGIEPAAAPVPDSCEVTDFGDATMLPGLIDAHVHLCGDCGPRALDQLGELTAGRLDAIITSSLHSHLDAGVTTVRDLGDIDYAVLARRGAADLPTVLASGPPITSVGGHCAVMGGEVAGIDGLRAAVRERAERGADVVKIMTSGGTMSQNTDITECQFSLEELCASVDESHRCGLPMTGHAHALAAVERCLAAGVDGIEHCSCLTPAGFVTPPDLVAGLGAAGTAVCATLGVDSLDVLPPNLVRLEERTGMTWDDRLAQAAALCRGGVRMIGGTDAGINHGKPHGLLPKSIADHVTCGLSPARAIAAATAVGADALGLGDRKGHLRSGYDADLLVVAGDPLADIAALQDVAAVVLAGRVVRGGSGAAPPA